MNSEQGKVSETLLPTVVLIDNSRAMQSMLHDCLARFEVSLLHYDTVEAAHCYLRDHQPNLVFLNLLMPDKNGLIYLRELRHQPMHRSTRIVIISSKDYEQDRVTARKLGAAAFLVKPMPMQILTDTVLDSIAEDEIALDRTLPL